MFWSWQAYRTASRERVSSIYLDFSELNPARQAIFGLQSRLFSNPIRLIIFLFVKLISWKEIASRLFLCDGPFGPPWLLRSNT